MLKYFFLVITTATILSSCSSRKYVQYLDKQTEIVNMSDSLHFQSLDKEFYENDLFFVGEIHEVETSPRIDFALFTQINEKNKIDTYLSEMDLAQAYYLREYLKGSDELSLKEILKDWAVYIGSISNQYRQKWVKMRSYYAGLPQDAKFDIVGLDKFSDFDLLRRLVKEKLPNVELPSDNEALFSWAESTLKPLLATNDLGLHSQDMDLLRNIEFNLKNYPKIKSRDKFMYENFKRYYAQLDWENKKLYGGFGFAHTLQAYNYTLAGRIKQDTTMSFSQKMVSMNALYVDSRLTVQSMALPKFMQDKGKDFTRFKFSYDNRIVMYIKGIADYKKVTKPHSISLIKLDDVGSPYLTSTRGTKTSRLIPIWEGFDIIDGTSTTDYAQYVLFVRNADWIVPDKL